MASAVSIVNDEEDAKRIRRTALKSQILLNDTSTG